MKQERETRDRARLLPWLMLPVGAEVGFSSAGAGALGSAALLSLTPLAPAQVVGTDIAFGFLTSSLGSGAHWFAGAVDAPLLTHLVAGGVVGAVCGTMLAGSVPKRPLRFALWVWLLVIGGIFLYHSAQCYCRGTYATAAALCPPPIVALLMSGFAQKPTLQT